MNGQASGPVLQSVFLFILGQRGGKELPQDDGKDVVPVLETIQTVTLGNKGVEGELYGVRISF